MNLADVRVEKAYSKEGVPVTIDAVANVKISGDEGMLDRAVERFLGTDARQIQQIIKETLEGQLRDIIGVLTVEELYQKNNHLFSCSYFLRLRRQTEKYPRSQWLAGKASQYAEPCL